MTDWFSFFADFRVVSVRNEEVVQGLLHPDLRLDDPPVREMLSDWPGTHFVHDTEEGIEITLVRPLGVRPPERWWLHILLGLATLLTTTTAGAYFLGYSPVAMRVVPLGPLGVPVPISMLIGDVVPGLIFSVPLLGILLGHEMGHYLVARSRGMDVSPPYFIPSPHWINVIGTFGAFIRIRSAVINRGLLLDVGMGGPLASFVLSLPVVVIGLAWSRALPPLVNVERAEYVVTFGGQPIWLGGSLAFNWLAGAFGPEGAGAILLHPLAFAGWLGLFVTALNLFPLAQLDGGHILYALVGAAQRFFGLAFLALLIGLGFLWWGWWLWAGLIMALGRGTIRHPSVFDPTHPVSGFRRVLGWACVAIFLLTFVPLPIRI